MSKDHAGLAIVVHGVITLVALVLMFATRESGVSSAVWILLLGTTGAVVTTVLMRRFRRRHVEELQHTLSKFESETVRRPDATPQALLQQLQNRGGHLQEAMTRMQAERERLAAILASMTEGVIAIDRHENIVLANEASHAAMEGQIGSTVGRPLRELVRSVKIHDLAADALQLRTPDPIECELPRSNRIVTVKADIIGGNPPSGAVLTIHDISELRRLERIRQEFVANVSHELKTPLTAIQACADTLSAGAIEEPEPARRFLARIDEHCARLGELVADMLALARIESGQVLLEIQPVDLEQLLYELVHARENITATQQLSLSVEAAVPPFVIESDLRSLRTLLENLVDNAIKYTPTGGSVRLKLDHGDATVIIRVQDTGIGIDRQHIKRIFQRFYRVDSARSRGSGGSGLGLAIVKHLAQQLGGTIDVQSEPEVGSTFTVQLPLRHPRAVAGANKESPGNRPGDSSHA